VPKYPRLVQLHISEVWKNESISFSKEIEKQIFASVISQLRDSVRSDACLEGADQVAAFTRAVEDVVKADLLTNWERTQAILQIATWLNSLPQWPQTSRPKMGVFNPLTG